MIIWKKVSAGSYISEDERWYATSTYDRVYGDHWKLMDENDPLNEYHEKTLKECKRIAEIIEAKEQGKYKSITVTDDMF